mmetsp:Transcript_3442/g.5582  ORF Transcript_3442/g.5582 Transcript_3442/m.5582 type:complete len:319 (-) Transcript_3442:314-1270(-)
MPIATKSFRHALSLCLFLTFPITRNDLLCLLHLLKLSRRPLLIPLVLVRMILPYQSLKLLLQPSALDILRPFLQIDGQLQYLGVVSLRRPAVRIPRVFIVPIILLPSIPHLLLMHRLLQLVMQFALLLRVLPIVLRDQVERLAKVGHGLVVVHVHQQRLGADEVRLLPRRVGHHHGIAVVRRAPQLHGLVAVLQRLLVPAHAGEYRALLQLDATAEQRGIDVEASHRREAIVDESRGLVVVPLLDLLLGLVEELDHLFQPAVLLPRPILLGVEFEHVLVEGYGVLAQAELHRRVGAQCGRHHFGIVVPPRFVIGSLGD